MTTRKTWFLLLAIGVAIAYAQSWPPGVAAAGEEAAVSSEPTTAATEADYISLANTYDDLAKQARVEAEKHRKMAESYRGGMKATYLERMQTHCGEIVSLQEKLAEKYTQLAETYRAEAAEMGD